MYTIFYPVLYSISHTIFFRLSLHFIVTYLLIRRACGVGYARNRGHRLKCALRHGRGNVDGGDSGDSEGA
jgi:hypothetical protein